jgi:hypothetical protein
MRRDEVPLGGIRAIGVWGVPRRHSAPPGRQSAAAARDDGLSKISRYTWRAGAAGVACSSLIAVSFGHHGAAAQPKTSGGNHGQGTIVVPAQPPAPAGGAGQVTSGAS